MPVTDNARIVSEAGNGTKTAFDFSFKIFAAADLICYKVSAAGVYTLGVITTDYTVSFDSDAETGVVTWTVAPVSSGKSVIIGSVTQDQDSELPREAALSTKTLQDALDKLTVLVQELQEQVDRAAVQPQTPVNPAAVVIDAPTDGKLVYWDLDDDTGEYHLKSSSVSATV